MYRAQGFVNHSFFPLKGKTEGLFACCIWEAKEGLGCADVEQVSLSLSLSLALSLSLSLSLSLVLFLFLLFTHTHTH